MSSCSVINSSIAPHLDPSDMDDNLLVQSAQAGEEWAFVELCTRNSKRVFNTIYGVTKNREDAEDALQDSMMRRGQMEGHSMKQIARNMGISVPATKSRLARAKVALRKSMVSTAVSTAERVAAAS